MLAAKNCGRWSESAPRVLERTLFFSALELLVTLVGCTMLGKNI